MRPPSNGGMIRRMGKASLPALLLLSSCVSSPRIDSTSIAGIEHAQLTSDARDLLERNGFVVLGGAWRDISRFYGSSEPLPKFITVDCVIEVFLLELERSWVKLEIEQAKRLEAVHAQLWDAALAHARDLPEGAQAAARRLLGLIAVGRLLLDPAWTPPEAPVDRGAVDADLARVLRAEGVADSRLWKRSFDWALFKPVGPYAASESLERLYRFSRWWGFPGLEAEDPEEALCAGLLGWLAATTPGLSTKIQEVESLYDSMLGPPEGPTLLDFRPPEGWRAEEFATPRGDAWLRRSFQQGKRPILEREGDRRTPAGERPASFRLHPPRMTPEVAAFSRTLHPRVPGRWLPRGLDALASRGNPRARRLTVQMEPESSRKTLERCFDQVATDPVVPQDHFQSRLWDLCDALSRPAGGGDVPGFMKTEAWVDRGLSAALATWAGARELYSPKAIDVFETKGIAKYVPPLVEPNVRAWRALTDLCLAMPEGLRCGQALEFAQRFSVLADRQGRGEGLREEDFIFGDRMFHSLLQMEMLNSSDFPRTLPDRRVCVSFARVAEHPGSPASTARWAGKACCPIYVVAEANGRPQLYLGGVLDYREFDRPAGAPLGRREFRELMNSKEAPPAPAWTASYRAPEKR